jgi:ribonuclease HII
VVRDGTHQSGCGYARGGRWTYAGVANKGAMTRAVEALETQPDFVKVDGNKLPKWHPSKEACISAASILAKVARDSQMYELHLVHPEFGFDKHKGYPTVLHMQKLQESGPLPEHRLSFKPVREMGLAYTA